MRAMALLARLVVSACVLSTALACTKAQAKTPMPPPAPPPALKTPNAPARLIVPQPLPPAAATEPAAPQPPRDPQRQTPRPADKPVTPPTTPPAAVPDPPVVVQTQQNADALEQQARRQIASARTFLSAVKYDALSASARSTYENVQGFIRQAEQSIRIKNFVFAAELADKAAELARELARQGTTSPRSTAS